MTFSLTSEYVKSFLEPASRGDWNPFINAIDPDVKWIIVDPVSDPSICAGTFNLQSWTEKIAAPNAHKIEGPLLMRFDDMDVFGNKALVEARSENKMKNGRPYNNRYAWIMIFSAETGKIVELREYMNSALVKELVETN